MSENTNNLASAEAASPNPGAAKGRKRKGYVKYSPLSLVVLAFCAFVFSFSVLGLFEQTLLDTAEEGRQETLAQIGFPDDGGWGDPNDLPPSPVPNLNQWQNIHPSQIDTSGLPFLRNANFPALKQENPDTVAWVYWPTTADVKGLPLNLPVVQGADNEYYLSRSFDGSQSDNGWVYVDYRNNVNNLRSNRNLILYGHARSYLVFGGLKYLNTKSSWVQDGYNHFIYINTPNERTVWQVFSWYETTVDFNYINTYFSDDEDYVEFLLMIQSKNMIEGFEKKGFSGDDRILTLSTCKGEDENVRVAVHAVLVKHEWINGEPIVTDDQSNFPMTDTGTGTDPFGDVTDSPDSPTDMPTDLPTDTDSATEPSGGTSSGGDVGGSTDTGTPTDRPTDSSGTSSGGGDTSTDTGTPSDTQTGSSGGSSDPVTDTDTPADTSSGSGAGGNSASGDGSSDPSSVSSDSDSSSDSGTPTDLPAA